MIGAARFGRTSPPRIRTFPAPIERLASTNSFCFSDSVLPLTTRATYGHENSAITTMTIVRPGLTRPLRQPSFVVLQDATIPMRDEQLRDREHDVRPA